MTDANLHISASEFIQRMNEPGIWFRFNSMSTEDQNLIGAQFAHFIRAENGDRARPDLLPDGLGYKRSAPTVANQHGLPDPHMAPDTHRPDRTPEQIAALRNPVERLRTEHATEWLQEKMGTDRDLPEEPPSMRDQIEAAFVANGEPTDSYAAVPTGD